jgi:S-adenosyl methyltransferase
MADGMREAQMVESQEIPEGVDPTTPSPARLYDYYLGGENNFQVDRDAAEQMRLVMPELSDAAWANRGFHQRAAKWMARRDVRQFIDIGSGLPTRGNTHDAVQAVDPAARVVYVDNDPMVTAHARGLLAGDGSTSFIQGDLNDPDGIFGHPDLRRLIDLSEPTGLLMTAVVHFVADDGDPWGLVARYVAAVAPGSYLALSHSTMDKLPPRMIDAGLAMYARASQRLYPRSLAEVERFFEGLEFVPPYPGAAAAVCHAGLWGAEDPEAADSDGSRVIYCGVARRP